MDMSQPLIVIGHMVITVGEALAARRGAFGAVAHHHRDPALAAAARQPAGERDRSQARREAELQNQLAEMTGRMHTFMQATANRDAHLAQNLNERLDGVTFKLGQNLHENNERTGEHLRVLHERLAVIDTAQKNLTELSTQMVGLQDILANKQTRGAFGQAQMEACDRRPVAASAYAFQPTLSNGSRPDCIVKMPDGGLDIVIDAKFPLEAFTAFREAQDRRRPNWPASNCAATWASTSRTFRRSI